MTDSFKETIVYIHGVSGDGQESHREEYETLHSGISSLRADWPQEYLGVEWGWYPRSTLNPLSHELLTRAQHVLGTRAMGALAEQSDFTLNPLRLAVEQFRPLFIFNISDMFYYVSMQGKNAIRLAFAKQFVTHLKQELTKPDRLISLTLIGHSAGSVIAFDTLFYLFFTERKREEYVQPNATPDGTAAANASIGKSVEQTLSELQQLKELAVRGRLRVRRLITLGSPITPLAFRSDSVLRILARSPPDNRLRCEWHGLTQNPPVFGAELKGPRWINLWDKDDPIAWPVEPLMQSGTGAVKDVYVDVSDSLKGAHNAYWASEAIHEVITDAW